MMLWKVPFGNNKRLLILHKESIGPFIDNYINLLTSRNGGGGVGTGDGGGDRSDTVAAANENDDLWVM